MTAACPACTAAPLSQTVAAVTGPTREVLLALPNIHCANCIAGVENVLSRLPGVAHARVNLSRRVARVTAEERVGVEEMLETLARAGHEAQEMNAEALEKSGNAESRQLLIYLAVAGFAAMNVMLLSVSVWAGADATTRDFMHWISAAIALPTLAVVSRPFYKSAFAALRARRLNMDVPITLALVLAAALSLFETISGGAHAYYDAALSLSFFLLVGRYLERRARHLARSAAADLAALESPFTLKITASGQVETPIEDVCVGDQLLVPAGERCPVDGVVGDSGGIVDISHLTGESQRVLTRPGDEIAAGALSVGGPMTVTATAVGADTSLRRMAQLVETVERGGGRYATLADRAARIYAPAVHLIALATFLGWMWFTGDLRAAVFAAVSTLIITCPCALGLASPAVAAAAMSKAFKRGALLKSGSALERLAEIDAVVLDKTGTIEAPEPALKSELSDETLTIACALSQGSRHPFSRTLLAEANSRGLTTIQATDIQEFAGEGLKGQFQGQNIRLGSAAFVGATPGDGMETWLAIEGQTPIRIAFASTPREGAAAMVDGLRKLGIEVSLLSGDRERAVSTCAEALNIDNWIAGATPAEKLHKVQEISASGRKVLMVGDGINDVGAIAAAHVSAAMASGLEAARSNADVVLMKSDLLGVAQLIQTARSARRRILENFWLAGLYNACAIPLAIAGYASPLAAALAMSSSSILVVLNAMRVK